MNEMGVDMILDTWLSIVDLGVDSSFHSLTFLSSFLRGSQLSCLGLGFSLEYLWIPISIRTFGDDDSGVDLVLMWSSSNLEPHGYASVHRYYSHRTASSRVLPRRIVSHHIVLSIAR